MSVKSHPPEVWARKTNPWPSRPDCCGREGIALIVVLGFLSALVLLAVAFSVIMRTERLASRNYNDQVRTRQLVHAALARIVADHIGTSIGDSVYPPWEAIYSQPGRAAGSPDFVSPQSDGWVYNPMSLWKVATNSNRAQWLPLKDPDPQDGRLYGEYAYVVVNHSGLLDANIIGSSTTNRSYGYDPSEIRFSYVLPEFFDNTLYDYRTNFVRFECLPELYYLASSAAGAVSMGGVQRALNQLPGSYADNLHVYSRYPKGYAVWDPNLPPNGNWKATTNVTHIGDAPATWDVAQLQASIADLTPNPLPDTRAFINALQDYADEDLTPSGTGDDQKFKRFSSEPVPMINEIIVRNTILPLGSADGTNRFEHRVYIIAETYFPFPNEVDATTRYYVRYGQPQLNVAFQLAGGAPPFVPASGGGSLSVDPTPDSFQLSTNMFRHIVETTKGEGDRFRILLNMTDAWSVRMNNDAGPEVDKVFGPWNQAAFLVQGTLPALTVGAEIPIGTAKSVEVNDPRINWDAVNFGGADRQWDAAGGGTPGAMNSRVNGPVDQVGMMYASSKDLRSVGEIGYLLYDATKPWETVRLLSPDPDGTSRLLDRLVVHDDLVRQGLVNINTRQTNVLAAMFYHMPIEPYPGCDDSYQLTKDNALELASYVYRTNSNADLGSQVAYSDVGSRWRREDMEGFAGAWEPAVSTNKFWADSFVRNSIGLWGMRHNMFTVFVAARVFDDAYSKNPAAFDGSESDHVVGEQYAVSVLWRDPFVTEDRYGTAANETFTRFFHWLVLLFED